MNYKYIFSKRFIIGFSKLAVLLLVVNCTPTESKKETTRTTVPETVTESSLKEIPYTIIATQPHDANAFTEGFLFYKNQLFESTGATTDLPQTKSLFGIVDVKTGAISAKAELDKNIYFGEGITILKDKVYQVTYKNQLGFIYNTKNYQRIGQFNYANREGWGLTNDGTYVIMSDGSSDLTYFNTEGMTVYKTLSVSNNGYIEEYLNELEFINGFIYANVWLKNYIVKINPADGTVVGIINLDNLVAQEKASNFNAKELNGIAFDTETNKIVVTGKMWKNIYHIDFKH